MLRTFFTLLLAIVSWPATAAAQHQPDALLVISSHGRDGGETQPGFEMDELAQAWLVLSANGYDVHIGSPEGGAVVADRYDADKAYNAEFLADPIATRRLAETLRLDRAMGDRFDIVMVIGGKGAMFDLPDSQILHRIILDQHERGGIVAAVCHGPAVLARITREDGTPFVAGKQLSAFTNEEEAAFGKKWVPQFPFLIETRFLEQGASFGESPIMLPYVAVDGTLVTGQNPFSVVAAAEAAIRAAGGTPIARESWADERSMNLLADAVAGDRQPLLEAVAADPDGLDLMLIAAWAYYRSEMEAVDAETLALAIDLVELVRPHLDAPELDQILALIRQRHAALCQGDPCTAS